MLEGSLIPFQLSDLGMTGLQGRVSLGGIGWLRGMGCGGMGVGAALCTTARTQKEWDIGCAPGSTGM